MAHPKSKEIILSVNIVKYKNKCTPTPHPTSLIVSNQKKKLDEIFIQQLRSDWCGFSKMF